MGAGDLVLQASDGTTAVTVEIAVEAGARLRRISIERAGDRVEVLAEPPPGASASSTGWGSFPMAPWAGRVRHGRFRFLGREILLDLNHADEAGVGGGPIVPPLPADAGTTPADSRRHAIHGTTFSRPWTIETADADTCSLRCSLTGALGWPFEGTARQRLELRPDRLDLELAVEAADGSVFPASIGWHPWFAKPDRLDVAPVAMYRRDGIGIPTGELVSPTSPPWDDCFVNFRPVRLHYDRTLAATITVTSDADHWVVYDMPAHATCVEPQSGPPDAPTLRPQIVATGHPLTRSMTISW